MQDLTEASMAAASGPMKRTQTKNPLWCDHCATANEIVIGSVCHRHWCPPGHVEVTYFCTRCNAIYRHLVTNADVDSFSAAALVRSDTASRDLDKQP